MKKNLLSLLVVFALALCLVACKTTKAAGTKSVNKTTTNPVPTEAKITDGYFTYSFAVDGTTRSFYIHFYENGVFYFSGLNGGQILVGRYEVTDTQWEGDYYLDREAASPSDPNVEKHTTHGTAPQTLVFKNLAGKEIGKSGYDKATGKLYDVNAEGQPGYCQSLLFSQDLEFKPSAATGAENGVALYTFEDPEDDTCYVSINHDGSYTDMMVTQVNGTWVQTGTTYALTPEDPTDTAATLVVDETGKNALYKVDGEDDVELVLHEEPLILEEKFVGETKVLGQFDGVFTLELYTNGTAAAIITQKATGAEVARVDGGSWTKDATTGEIQMIMIGGEAHNTHQEGIADDSKTIIDGKFTLTLKVSGHDVSCEVEYVPQCLLSVESGADSIKFYPDFTFEATAYSGQAPITGTWSMPGYSLELALTGDAAAAMTISATMDQTSHDFTVEIKRGDSVAVSFVLPAAEWGSKLQGKSPIILTVESGSDSISFNQNFTFKATAYSGQAPITGTWSMPGYSLELALTGDAAAAMTISATMDQTSHDFTVEIKRGDSVAVSFVLPAAEWGSKLQGKAPAQD